MKILTLILVLISTFQLYAQDLNIIFTANNCLDGQDMYAEDVDISNCPALPAQPESVILGDTDSNISLGAWELGQTANGDTYKYGYLNESFNDQRILSFYGEENSVEVNRMNIECWAKGYYRLRNILQNPPVDYITLFENNFQVRFFQFQTDLRNGSTGFKKISSYMDHLVKWVTIVSEDGKCVQPTLSNFEEYLADELINRNL